MLLRVACGISISCLSKNALLAKIQNPAISLQEIGRAEVLVPDMTAPLSWFLGEALKPALLGVLGFI
jgi:hypothetical protein